MLKIGKRVPKGNIFKEKAGFNNKHLTFDQPNYTYACTYLNLEMIGSRELIVDSKS